MRSQAVCNEIPCVQVKRMTQYVRDTKFAEFDRIPDPYFGGAKGFELVRRRHDTPNHASCTTSLPWCQEGNVKAKSLIYSQAV